MERRWFSSYPEGVERNVDVEIQETTVVDFLEDTIKASPDHRAIVFENESYTYKEFGQIVRRVASSLQDQGVKKGTRVALMMNNSPDYVFSYFAILYAGGVVVQNNPMYKERELGYQLTDSGSELLIIEKSLLDGLEGISDIVSKIIVARADDHPKYDTLKKLINLGSEDFEPVAIKPKEDLAVLQYTGGTTGVSKGAKLTHYNLAANVIQTDEFVGLQTEKQKEKLLNVLPLFHVYGMTVSMNYCIYLQSTLYLVERFEPNSILELLHNEKITMLPGTPTIYVAVNSAKNIEQYDLSAIHTCLSGSAPLPTAVRDRFCELTGANLLDAYGLTEASPVTHCNPITGESKPGSIGIPIYGTDCKIVDLEEGLTECKPNEPGELIVKGAQVMEGYYKRDDETEEALRDGWLYTGDVAYMDEDGYCFIVSRKKDVIIASGYNIYPREIEEVLYEHPNVTEVVVCGIPDAYRGETVKAFIVKKDASKDTEEDFIAYSKERLAKFKIPSQIEFREELPKSKVGKILRRVLIEEETSV
ncbi:long-chain-fatty-acid--CoA ligase [Geomicrobium sediminis]|uniref:Long-chain acyl-CoA synthetase n=1 Tax=Geomicrobium sediminis TaxID=1347788 RepID=A0ABS2PCM7_9BACL|nr:long-chain fatty acid--CoA ligase [Geomicrobium sediminis]MBM7632815.1 long-chain acyl-CoA synthetase [Geomicrobium sediminis]